MENTVPLPWGDVVTPNAAFLVFSGHKLLGPSGVDVLYGLRELLDGMPSVPWRR